MGKRFVLVIAATVVVLAAPIFADEGGTASTFWDRTKQTASKTWAWTKDKTNAATTWTAEQAKQWTDWRVAALQSVIEDGAAGLKEEDDLRKWASSHQKDLMELMGPRQDSAVPGEIEQARTELKNGELGAAQQSYLKYLRSVRASDDQLSFIMEAGSAWSISYSRSYGEARQLILGLGADDTKGSVSMCVSGPFADQLALAVINGKPGEFSRVKQRIEGIQETFKAVLKEPQQQPQARATALPILIGYGPAAVREAIKSDSACRDRIADVLADSFKQDAVIDSKNLLLEFVELRRDFSTSYRRLREMEQSSDSLSSLSLDRLRRFNLEQRKHWETVDKLVRCYYIDIPLHLKMACVQVRFENAVRFYNDDEKQIYAAGLDLCSLNPLTAYYVDKSTHEKWMTLVQQLKAQLSEKEYEELKALAKTAPDWFSVPTVEGIEQEASK